MPTPTARLRPASDDVGRDDACASFLITPNQSLSDAAARTLYGCIIGAVCILQVPLFANGLWPVSVFMALDAVGLIVAVHVFRLCQKHRCEEIIVKEGAITIRRHGFRKPVTKTTVQRYGIRLERCDDDVYGCVHLFLSLRGRRVEIADYLSPAERETFARALIEALRPQTIPVTYEPMPALALPKDETCAP